MIDRAGGRKRETEGGKRVGEGQRQGVRERGGEME